MPPAPAHAHPSLIINIPPVEKYICYNCTKNPLCFASSSLPFPVKSLKKYPSSDMFGETKSLAGYLIKSGVIFQNSCGHSILESPYV